MARLEAKTDVTGSVWKITTTVGQKLEPGDTVMLIESMKMEIPVAAPRDAGVKAILVSEGVEVVEGQALAVLETGN